MMHALASPRTTLALVLASSVLAVAVVGRDPVLPCRADLSAHGNRCCTEVGAGGACVSRVDPRLAGPVRRVRFEGGRLEVRGQSFERASARDLAVELAPFALAREEVRCADALAVLGSDATELTVALCAGDAARAAAGLRFSDAERVCAALGGRVPSEGEWERAAGSGGTRYPWGETGATCRVAVWGLAGGPCGRGLEGPDTVGARPAGATPEGIVDLAGNVAEWVRAEEGPAVKGGDFTSFDASTLRVLARRSPPPEIADARHGARCAFETAR
jgi:formylglycine-generating enzyme